MRLSTILKCFLLAFGVICEGQDEQNGETPSSQERLFIEIQEQEVKPTVKAISPIDDTNVFFLNQRGQPGVAKFSPGLSLIGWELYSKIKLDPIDSLTIGPNYSILTASAGEVTQAFDTDRDGQLDFFQGLVREWTGRDSGVRITAGPIADQDGRLLFALSPHAAEEGQQPLARIVAWHPTADDLHTVTESQLLVSSFVVGPDRLLAARLSMPTYRAGYYISLTELPARNPAEPNEPPTEVPKTLPSLLVPAELTAGAEPTQMTFFRENGQDKLLLTCPESKRLIEIVPEKEADQWQGAILLRSVSPFPIETVVEMKSGLLLGGGAEGFFPIEVSEDAFRIKSVSVAEDGIVLNFSSEIDRIKGVKADSYTVKAVSLRGENADLEITPVIESDGKAVILKTDKIGEGLVLRISCLDVTSASGESLTNGTVFYTIHQD